MDSDNCVVNCGQSLTTPICFGPTALPLQGHAHKLSLLIIPTPFNIQHWTEDVSFDEGRFPYLLPVTPEKSVRPFTAQWEVESPP